MSSLLVLLSDNEVLRLPVEFVPKSPDFSTIRDNMSPCYVAERLTKSYMFFIQVASTTKGIMSVHIPIPDLDIK